MDFRTSPRPLLVALSLCLFALGRPVVGTAADEILGGKLEKKTTKTDAELKAAVTRLEKQRAADPKNYHVLFDLGNAYSEAQDQEKAKEAFQSAIDLNPKYVEAMVNLGGLYSDLEDYDEAIKWFQQALSIDPENCKARSNLGNAYYSRQRYPDAMFEYRRAVDQDANCYSAMYNIAVAFADAGLFREAVNWWKKVEAAAPGTDAARSAQENIGFLDRFTKEPVAPAPAPKPAPTAPPKSTTTREPTSKKPK